MSKVLSIVFYYEQEKYDYTRVIERKVVIKVSQISFGTSPIKDATLCTKLVKSNLVSFNIVSIVNAQCLRRLLEVPCGIRVILKM